MTQIKKITDKQGNDIYLRTHTKAVIDDNGYTAESRLQAMQDEINQEQLAVGAVPSDLTPTENSSNWVTSGGIKNALDNIVVNSLLDERMNVAISAYIGTVLKSKIEEVYDRVKDLYSELGNLAFWNSKPAMSTLFPDLTWEGDTVTLTLSLTNCSAQNAPEYVVSGGNASMTVIAQSGYKMPLALSTDAVENATLKSYTRSADGLSVLIEIENITDNVEVTISAVSSTYNEPEGGEIVFWLDGKDLTSSPTTWVDKVSGKKFTNVGGTTVSSNGNIVGISFNGSSQRMYTSDEFVFLPAEHTIEIVCKPISVNSYKYNYLITSGYQDTDDPSLKTIHAVLYKNGSTNYLNGVYINNTGTLNQDGTWTGGHVWNVPFTLNQNMIISSNKICAVNSGISLQSLGANHWTTFKGLTTEKGTTNMGAGSTTPPSEFFYSNTVIYAIRIYRGQLTEAQMLANQKIDNEYYNLGLTLPDSI